MNNTVQLRVDSKTKHAVAAIFASLGMDVSTGIKIYLERVIKEEGIPFSVTTKRSEAASAAAREWKKVRGLWKDKITESPLKYQRRIRAEE